MAQPTWNTSAGSIGTFNELSPVSFTFSATAGSPGNTLQYTILNGVFPESTNTSTTFSLSTGGVLTGTAAEVSSDTTYYFTIRVNEFDGPNFESFADRTFSLTIAGTDAPSFVTSPGSIGTTSAQVWFSYQILISNPDPNTTAIVRLISGNLPPGLEINSDGLIQGYPGQVATSTTSSFKLEVMSESGSANATFSITVNVNAAPIPAIFNTRPPTFSRSVNDPNTPYYLDSTGNIGIASQDNFFIFKILGNDWTSESLTYSIISGSLPGGLIPDPNTGYIYGTIASSSSLVQSFPFTVQVTNSPSGLTNTASFVLTVVDSIDNVPIDPTVSWLTDAYLGSVDNGSISTLVVEAVAASGVSLTYSITSGSLPTDLQLLSTGEIVGKIAFETESSLTPIGDTNTYTFEITASNPSYPSLITASRTFTLDVYQKFDSPYENIYIKALLNVSDRTKLDTLLNDTTIIPSEYLYRSEDPNFGKASDVIYQHIFGIPASTIQTYIDSMIYNHYWRNITLGELKTAIARNSNNEIIYEVVYSEVVDNLVNQQGISISKEVDWPVQIGYIQGTSISAAATYTNVPVNEAGGAFVTVAKSGSDTTYTNSNTTILVTTSGSGYTVGQTVTVLGSHLGGSTPTNDLKFTIVSITTNGGIADTQAVYPNSLPNMREQVSDYIGNQITDPSILPAWMTSQQRDGGSLGFKPAWVICYTLPNIVIEGGSVSYEEFANLNLNRDNYLSCAETIKNNIISPLTNTVTITESSSLNNAFTCISTAELYINMQVKFTAKAPNTIFGGITSGTSYFIQRIISETQFCISDTPNSALPKNLTDGGTNNSMNLTHVTWNYVLNQLNFELDRIEVNRSLTYDYDPITSTWSTLPSGVVSDDSQDNYVYFPQKTIIG
jgi:hypothetical protein